MYILIVCGAFHECRNVFTTKHSKVYNILLFKIPPKLGGMCYDVSINT